MCVVAVIATCLSVLRRNYMQHERYNKGESAVYLPSEHAVVLEPFHCWVNVTQPINSRALWMQRLLLWEDAQQIIRTTALQSVVNRFQVTVVTARTSLVSRLCQSLRSLVPAFHLRLLTNKTNRASPPLNAPTSGPSNLVRTHTQCLTLNWQFKHVKWHSYRPLWANCFTAQHKHNKVLPPELSPHVDAEGCSERF